MTRKTAFTCLLFLFLTSCNDPAPAENFTDSEVTALPDATLEGASESSSGNLDESTLPARHDSIEQLQAELGVNVLADPHLGDLDSMVERRLIRVLTVYGIGRYYLDGGQEKGAALELFRMFEDFINKRLDRKTVRVHVAFIPVARHELVQGLLDGRGDIAAASLTITPERDELIDFTAPVSRELSEVLVTGPSAPPLATLDDLAGREIFVRASSSYRSSVDAINRQLIAADKAPIVTLDASEYLEDEDLLEMVNAGLLNWAIVDSYKAEIWAGVFENLTVREDIVFRSGGRIAYALRENSPQLKSALDEFLKSHRQGTLKGNILINRYVKNFDWAGNALASQDYQRFNSVVGIFEKYGNTYGIDYLIAAAQGYQESRLDQSVRSRAGAVGIMQLLPSTAADPNVGIPDISEAESNIHAGVKYLDFIRSRYFSDPEIDRFNQTLFALAAYNAGPARINRLRSKAAAQGYDPNRWFDHVELIAAREIGRETVQYVANIIKYYVAYRLSAVRQVQRSEERKSIGID
jgi:membrane-bound lytic murein transglycosylase MltF